jgi:hypothetical protein
MSSERHPGVCAGDQSVPSTEDRAKHIVVSLTFCVDDSIPENEG